MNKAWTLLFETVCLKSRFPLAIVDIHKNHGWDVLACDPTEPSALLPTTLARRLQETLQLDSPVHIQRNGGKVYIGIPQDKPAVVRFETVMRSFQEPGISFPTGMNMFDQVCSANLCVDTHALFTGRSGTGKSTLGKCAMRALTLTARDRVKIAPIDVAKPNSFKYIPADMIWGIGDRPATAENLLARVQDEVDERLRQTRKSFPYHLIVFIDELKSIARARPKVLPRIENLVKVARAAWVHVVIMSQSPRDIPDLILDELTCRAVFQLRSGAASRRALGHTMATGLRPGELFLVSAGKQELLRALSLRQ